MAELFLILGVIFITFAIYIWHLKARYQFTDSDAILNVFYKIRFWFYRNFYKKKLCTCSEKQKYGWDLLFDDDFNRKSWNGNGEGENWRWGEGWGQFHPDYPSSYSGAPIGFPDKSYALFFARHNPKTFTDDHKTGKPITIPIEKSLLSTTNESWRKQYGRYECRMTLPKTRGAWPAFWMWGEKPDPCEVDKDGNPVKYYAEIDCGEWYGKEDGKSIGTQCINLHWARNGVWGHMHAWKIKVEKAKYAAIRYHEYAFEWTPSMIAFYTDGVKVMQFTNQRILIPYFVRSTAKLWIIVNNGIDGNIITKDDTDYYSFFKADYVRAYKRSI